MLKYMCKLLILSTLTISLTGCGKKDVDVDAVSGADRNVTEMQEVKDDALINQKIELSILPSENAYHLFSVAEFSSSSNKIYFTYDGEYEELTLLLRDTESTELDAEDEMTIKKNEEADFEVESNKWYQLVLYVDLEMLEEEQNDIVFDVQCHDIRRSPNAPAKAFVDENGDVIESKTDEAEDLNGGYVYDTSAENIDGSDTSDTNAENQDVEIDTTGNENEVSNSDNNGVLVDKEGDDATGFVNTVFLLSKNVFGANQEKLNELSKLTDDEIKQIIETTDHKITVEAFREAISEYKEYYNNIGLCERVDFIDITRRSNEVGNIQVEFVFEDKIQTVIFYIDSEFKITGVEFFK